MADGNKVYPNLPFAQFGYLPGVAQAAQATVTPAPELNPQPYFTDAQYAVAQWFTTRVHLSPIGGVNSDD